MFVLIFFMMSFTECQLQWKLIEQSFTNSTIQVSHGWNSRTVCGGSSINQLVILPCSQNQNELVYLDYQNTQIYKIFPLRINQIRVILDVYYDTQTLINQGGVPTLNINLQTSNSIISLFTKSQLDLKLRYEGAICTQISSTPFELQTVVTEIISIDDAFEFSICFTSPNNNKIGIKNLLIYAVYCNPICKTCSPTDANYCLVCNDGRTSTSGTCICPEYAFVQAGIGCIAECPRDQYSSNYTNSICLYDSRITSNYTFFNLSIIATYSPFQFLPDPTFSYQKSLLITQLCFTQGNTFDVIGQFNGKEGIQVQLNSFVALSFIRLRITLYMFSWKDGTLFQVLIDGVQQAYITYQSYIYTLYFDAIIAYNSLNQCGGNTFDYIRLEVVLPVSTTNPLLTIQGQMVGSGTWSFNNLTIDIIVCQANCVICQDQYSCKQCDSGYILYKQQCLSEIPIFTSGGLDYSEELPISSYLIKGFYDVNMLYDDILSFFDFCPGNSLTGQQFSFFPNKIVLGGLLVWNNGKYSKTYNNLNPHYALTIRFNITFGDDFSGKFNYYLDSSLKQSIPRSVYITDQNIIGKSSAETIVHVYQYYFHTNTQIQIVFECVTTLNLIDGFCAISEYFVVIHQCQPGCLECTSLSVCTSWKPGVAQTSCLVPDFWSYDSASLSWICSTCVLIGCSQCATASYCKECQYSLNNKFTWSIGNCLCDESYHRIVFQGNCQCQNGYYDDIFTKNCWPICGDNLVVDGEDCDDGNNNPFDGCHQCKYSCSQKCEYCFFGSCLACQSGDILIEGLCYKNDAILDGQISFSYAELDLQVLKQCQDDNIIPQDGCFQSQYSCPENCLYCAQGLCIQCIDNWLLWDNQCISVCGNGILQGNEQCDNGLLDMQLFGCLNCICQQGYKIQNGNCLTICGDHYQTLDEECDDGNSIQYDGCYQCQLECLNCNYCTKGNCQQCKSGYYKDDQQICIVTQCGDSVKVGLEQCDDGNNFENDSCYKCNCENGWEYNGTTCISICGDGITVGNEQCDDGNTIEFDGCFECQYDCDIKCNQCTNGKCLDCQYGFNLVQNKCINICGDGILNKEIEQCDDKNSFKRDGCFNCQIEEGYICYYDDLIFKSCERCQDNNCLSCVAEEKKQTCLKCALSYFVDQQGSCSPCNTMCLECQDSSKNCIKFNYDIYQVKECPQEIGEYYDHAKQDCISHCGDNIISGSETCDDGNSNNYDGCNSKCEIEIGYLFNIENKTLIAEPQVGVEFKQTDNSEFKVVADGQYNAINCSNTLVTIEQFESHQFNYSINDSDTGCLLNIQYFSTIETYNLIHILINYKNDYVQRLLQETEQILRQLSETVSKEVIVTPKRTVYTSEDQKAQGQAVAATQKIVTSSIVVFGPIAALIGGFKLIWAVLDILSWINNFYFLNVCYPENVRLILLQSDWGNIINFPQVQSFNNPGDDYYFQSPEKFADKGIDPLFFNNIQQTIIFLFYVICTTILCYCFRRTLESVYKKGHIKAPKIKIFQLNENGVDNKQQNEENDATKQKQSQTKFAIPNYLKGIYTKSLQAEKYFFANILKTLQLSYLDITLAITLQITNQSTADFVIVKINLILSYATIIVILGLLYFTFKISITHKVLLENKRFSEKYDGFYEGISTESTDSMIYSFNNLVRKTIFIIFTVIFYDEPIFQTSMCFLSCLLNIVLVLIHNPFKTKQELILNFIPDLCVMIIVGITICFAFQDRFQMFNELIIYQLGWIIASCIYVSIGLQLLFLIKDLMIELWEKLKKLKNYFTNK